MMVAVCAGQRQSPEGLRWAAAGQLWRCAAGLGRLVGCCGCVPIPMEGVAEKQGVRSAFGYRDMPHPHPPLPHSAANCLIDWAKRQTDHGTRRRGSTLANTRRLTEMEQFHELLGKLTEEELEDMLEALRAMAA